MRYPKYVKMGDSHFRLRGDMYWLDAGEWGFSVVPATKKWYNPVNFDLAQFESRSAMESLSGKPVFECSESDWLKQNKGYIPSGYVLGDNSVIARVSDECDYYEDENGDIIDPTNDFMYLLIRR